MPSAADRLSNRSTASVPDNHLLVTLNAVSVIRIAGSFFVLVVMVIATAGWLWTTQHQPPAQAFASHVVLVASALASCGGLCAVWRRPRDSGQTPD